MKNPAKTLPKKQTWRIVTKDYNIFHAIDKRFPPTHSITPTHNNKGFLSFTTRVHKNMKCSLTHKHQALFHTLSRRIKASKKNCGKAKTTSRAWSSANYCHSKWGPSNPPCWQSHRDPTPFRQSSFCKHTRCRRNRENFAEFGGFFAGECNFCSFHLTFISCCWTVTRRKCVFHV